jgi:hypothetical protein
MGFIPFFFLNKIRADPSTNSGDQRLAMGHPRLSFFFFSFLGIFTFFLIFKNGHFNKKTKW